MNNILVSIIVPCYNQAQYLSEALDSVLAQTYPYWECIIVNDGSPDNTEEIAKIYCNNDNRFKYVQKVNGGLSSARNAGLNILKGDYVQFLDSDDTIDPQKFEKQLNTFTENQDLCISISNYYIFDNNKTIYQTAQDWNNKLSSDFRYDILFRWDKQFSIPIHCALFKARIIDKIRFNEKLLAKEDWLFWIDISEKIPAVHYIAETLAHYRIHSESMIRNNELMEINSIKVLFVILEKLNTDEKSAFSKRIEDTVLMLFENKYQLNEALISSLKKVQLSKAYRLGKFILKPFSFFSNVYKAKSN